MLVAYLLPVLLVVGLSYGVWRLALPRRTALARCAAGLGFEPDNLSRGDWVKTQRGFRVTLRFTGAGCVQAKVDSLGRIPKELLVAGQSDTPARGELRLGADRRPPVRARLRVMGPPDVALACLSADVRRALETRWRRGLSLRAGRIEVRHRLAVLGELSSFIHDVLDLADGLTMDRDVVPQRLLDNFRNAVDRELRVAFLDALLGRHGDGPEAAEAYRLAAHDADPRLRLRAGVWAGSEGLDPLRHVVFHPRARTATRVGALEAIFHQAAKRGIGDDTYELIEGLIQADDTRGTLLSMAARFLLAHRPTSQRGTTLMIALLDHLNLGEVRRLASGLDGAASPEDEPLLWALLEHRDANVKRAAIRALERGGTLASVEKLKPLTAGFFPDRSLHDAAERAIAAIQGRVKDADPGRLSLVEVDDDGGRLSLSESPGRLSRAEAGLDQDDGEAAG